MVLELGMQVELRADNRHIIVVLEYLLSREATFTSGQRQQEVSRYHATSWSKYRWLRGRATGGTCNCGAGGLNSLVANVIVPNIVDHASSTLGTLTLHS